MDMMASGIGADGFPLYLRYSYPDPNDPPLSRYDQFPDVPARLSA